MTKLTTSLSVAAILASTAISTSTFAQDIAVLEEIIVTAQKREQNLKDVPISVTAIKGEQFQDFAAAGEDIRALSGRVPGLNAESSNGRVAPRFYIRGLGNTDFDLAASQPVSIIMDDVVMENVVLKSFPLFDIERIEVLRGPQGTLFGRNTPAGIIKFDTRKPSQEANGYASINIGSLDVVNVESAYGAPISDTVSMRVSGIYSHRGDFIDNGYTGEENAMGGFNELAGRIQVLFEPNDKFDALVNLHARTLEGTSSIFRANIVNGSNDLNANYDAKTVWFDEGNNNPQEYDSKGMSIKMNYDLGGSILTSITAYETANGYSLGDIDGGYGAVYMPEMGPGFIPFNSATQDNVDDTNQFTQEIRLASDSDEALQWQAGLYYFSSDLSVTTSPFFIPSSTVEHENKSMAIFAQLTYAVAEDTTFTAGARYTDDKKTLHGVFAFGNMFDERVTEDRISWDVAVNHDLTDDIMVYTRIADGFRAASIQGRDIAFFGAPSVAKAETILSIEAGMKATIMDGRGRINTALYKWSMDDQQLSAVGGGGNFIQLVNASKTSGWGFEADMEFMITDNFTVSAGLSNNNTKIKDGDLRVGVCVACNVLDGLDHNGRAMVYGNSLPQAPDWLVNVSARYSVELEDGELYFSTDWFKEGDKSLMIYDSAEFKTSGDFEGGVKVGYIFGDGMYEAAMFGRNITNEHNLKGAIDFNNNTGFTNEPRVLGVSFRANF